MMIVTSPKLASLVIAAIPLVVFPIIAFGRNVRRALARCTGHVGTGNRLCFPNRWVAVRTLQAYTNEGLGDGPCPK